MSVYGGGGTCPPCNPEFEKAVPTNGFGEVEATVNASLGHPDAPRPRLIPIELTRKVCRIYSPVSTPRASCAAVGGIGSSAVGGIGSTKRGLYQQRDAPVRPHTADAALECRPTHMMKGARADVRGISGVPAAPYLHADATESTPMEVVRQRSRPMTSDGSSQRQKLKGRGLGIGRTGSSNISGDALGGQLRPSTSGGGRRRPPPVSHGIFDTGRASSTSSNANRVEANGGQQREQQKLLKQPPNQEEQLPQQEAQRLQETFANASTTNVNRFEPR